MEVRISQFSVHSRKCTIRLTDTEAKSLSRQLEDPKVISIILNDKGKERTIEFIIDGG